MKRILIGLVLTGLFSSLCVKAESLDQVGDNVFEQKVLEIIMKHPDVIEKSMTLYVEKKRKDQEAQKLTEALNNHYEVDYGKSPSQGKKKAKYQLVVFTDFECPYCKRGEETVQALKEKYGDDLFIVQKNYPLPLHKQARPAAKAALAAHQQEKFFEYSAKLFENQKNLGDDLYIKLAEDLKLNLDKFKKDMNSQEIKDLLKADIETAAKVEVGSTPNFILNGVKIAGAYPVEYFDKIIKMLETKK